MAVIYLQHLLHGVRPLLLASDIEMCRALFGFIVLELSIVCYLLPVADTHTMEPTSYGGPDCDGCDDVTVTVHTAFIPLPSFALHVTTAVPADLADTFPLLDTAATDVSLLVHATVLLSADDGATEAVS